MSIAIGGFDFKDAIADFQHRDIKGAPAQVINGDFFVLFLIQPVSQRGGGRLVNDAQDFQTGDSPCILGRLPLRVIEISRDSNHGLGNLLAQAHFSVGFHLRKNHGRDFRRTELLGFALHLDLDRCVAIAGPHHPVRDAFDLLLDFLVFAAHETLDGIHRIARIGHRLALCGIPHQTLTGLGKRHH